MGCCCQTRLNVSIWEFFNKFIIDIFKIKLRLHFYTISETMGIVRK